MTLTTAILLENDFVLSNGLYTLVIGEEPDEVSISFDSLFHIIIDNLNAYPMVTTVEAANARFAALSIELTLV